ncbi:DUF2892 domain-containing protein [Ureibacillus thermophilus]|uniref:DUF2892 domain-containing protein n=1 Tax=Ureibacillus thermophilus TaxID=367743 RepID=A0A4P6UP02_9BACL|nr:DUF2892 domain-containing protein [Ureibacillus thermophilus]QBK24694.1 DUF2892 domain-containing protein [Ureibacillus thermophilus]
MSANVGTVDRVIRIVLGLAILSLLFILEGNLKYLGLIGLIPFITGLVKFCPLYSLFKINTCQRK